MCILQRFYMNSKMKHHKKNINLVAFFKVYEEISKEFNISAHKQREKKRVKWLPLNTKIYNAFWRVSWK